MNVFVFPFYLFIYLFIDFTISFFQGVCFFSVCKVHHL